MKCFNHSEVEAEYFCQKCGKACCNECIMMEDNSYYCAVCRNTSKITPYENKKSPVAATLLSFFLPCSGQIYNAQYLKASTMIGSILGIIHMISTGYDKGYYDFRMGFIGGLVICAIWIYSIIDAYQEADRINKGFVAVVSGISTFWGMVLIVAGAVLLMHNFEVMTIEYLHKLWPLIFIIIGIRFIIKAYLFYIEGETNE